MMRKIIVIGCFLLLACVQFSFAQYKIKDPAAIPLHGEWSFGLDPAGAGVAGKWFQPDIASAFRFDKVTVPHCFSTDKRYEFYTGTAWYRKSFTWKKVTGKRIILHFDAAFYKTRVWLNGREVGKHEGGYTPFQFDVTDFLQSGANLLAVSVNNDTWQPGTIPGAKDNNSVGDPFVGWMNYGGLIRPVYLTVEPELYIENLKVDAVPDLVKGTATVRTSLRVRNASDRAISPTHTYSVNFANKPVTLRFQNAKIAPIAAGKTAVLEAEAQLTAAQVKLWGLDTPQLYSLVAVAGTDTISTRFGIRKFGVSGTQLLLNGQPLKLAGANRVVDYPELGSLEPDWLVEKDFRLMKEAGMEFHRLTHYTPSEYFYDLADEYGMLIITEVGNWQLTPRQMATDSIRNQFKTQFTEMAERDWNHPSVIAYSVGNEYYSLGADGQRWTRDMIDFARKLDPTRLYTFATMFLNTLPAKPEDEASQYVDFVSTNTYGNHAKALDHIHKLYPDKPVFISEWGTRADEKVEQVKGTPDLPDDYFGNSEVRQAQHVTDIAALARSRPYVVGASWWSFNDYKSRYPGTNVNGLRPWGLVRSDRSPRPAYFTHQKEMSPVIVTKSEFVPGDQGIHRLRLQVSVRSDFPSYAVKGYTVQVVGGTTVALPDLNPGESTSVEIPVRGFDKTSTVRVHKPTGFQAAEVVIDLK